MKKFTKFKALISILAVITLIVTVGCSEQTNNDTSQSKTQIEKSTDKSSSQDNTVNEATNIDTGITVYFPDKNGEKLIAVKKQINPNREDKYLAAVQSLIDGPSSNKEGNYIMPKNTKVLSVNVDNNVATVDFSKEFKSNFTGGSTGEIMLIGSIVNTLTEFDAIKAVRFTVEGKEIDTLSGHLDLSSPQTRMKNLL